MTRRRPLIRRLMDDTLVVGLVILAVAAIVLLITSRAQNGLPWQGTYDVDAKVPDAGKLTKNADVRIGGARVGQVLSIRAVEPKDGAPPHAELRLQLKRGGPLPADTKVEVRVASVLGGKYVSLVPGRSDRTIPEDGTLPLANAKTSVDLDEAFKVFDPAGRRGVRQVINELGTAFAGRGAEMNDTLQTTARVLPPLGRVLETLNAPATDLAGFVRGAAAATSALEPVAGELTPLVADASATMGALDGAGDRLGDAIGELPPTERAAGDALTALRPVLDDTADIARELRPAAARLGPVTRRLSATTRLAARTAPEVGSIAKPLDGVLGAVGRFTARPSSSGALRLLGSTDLATFGASAFVGLGALLNTTWEAEQNCRVATDWITALSEVLSDGDQGGNWIRMIPVFQIDEMLPSARPAAGLHANPYPVQNGQECEAGNEPYREGRQIGNVPGIQGAPGGPR